jgi:EPS-associated MarR family transcriptional regulator
MKLEEDHFQIIRKIDKKPHFSQRQLARELGFSLGKLNYCINELRKKGFIKIKNFKKNPKKLSYLYLLTPSGFKMKRDLTINFMKQKIREYDELKFEIEKGKDYTNEN